jgi:membrane fusion protein, multidrug efflux system
MRKLLVGFAAVVVIGGAIGVIVRHYSAQPTRESRPAPVPVVAAKVDSHPVPIFLRGVGTVIAFNNVVVRSQITGPIINISFRQGQTAHKGDLLAEIDPAPYKAQLDQAIANRDRDQAQLQNAQANLSRYTPLQAKGYASSQLVDTQKAQVAQLEAMVKSDEAAIESARVNLGYTRLTAPIDGVTGIRQIDQGNIIHPTDPNGLVSVTQIQPISLIFTLPETTLTKIQQEMDQGPVTVLAYSQDDKTQLDRGQLLLIDNQIIQTTGTIRLRATFPNARRVLWPGELVNVRLLLRTVANGLTVAAGAVQQGPNGSYVYVIGPDERAQLRGVQVDQISDGQALVTSGLNAGETVVVDGQYKLQPGTRVEAVHGDDEKKVTKESTVKREIP